MNSKLKTKMLREKYKEYLKPIDPLRPLGLAPGEMPGQTCFSTKKKFSRGEELFKNGCTQSELDKLEEFDKVKAPVQCLCNNVVQGIDPNRLINKKDNTNLPVKSNGGQHNATGLENTTLEEPRVPTPVREMREKAMHEHALYCEQKYKRELAEERKKIVLRSSKEPATSTSDGCSSEPRKHPLGTPAVSATSKWQDPWQLPQEE